MLLPSFSVLDGKASSGSTAPTRRSRAFCAPRPVTAVKRCDAGHASRHHAVTQATSCSARSGRVLSLLHLAWPRVMSASFSLLVLSLSPLKALGPRLARQCRRRIATAPACRVWRVVPLALSRRERIQGGRSACFVSTPSDSVPACRAGRRVRLHAMSRGPAQSSGDSRAVGPCHCRPSTLSWSWSRAFPELTV